MKILRLLILGLAFIALGILCGLFTLIGVVFALIWKLSMFALPLIGIVLIIFAFLKKDE